MKKLGSRLKYEGLVDTGACLLWAGVILFVVASCGAMMTGCAEMFPPPGPPVPDTAGTPEECGMACANLNRLGCPGADGSRGVDDMAGTVDDVSCTQACIDIVTADLTVTLNQRCVAEAATCKAADECQVLGD